MKIILKCIVIPLLLLPLMVLTACNDGQDQAADHRAMGDRKVDPPVVNPSAELVAAQNAFVEVYARVMPAVVNVSATRMRTPDNLGPLFEHFFGELFKRNPQPRRESKSLGSGFVISSEGYILTNEHVVKEAEEIEVLLADGWTLPARVVGADPRTDVAVIKVDSDKELPVTVLGDSDGLKVGQWALAIGNPFGLEGTLTVGVVSATERANLGIEDYENFIQTDASINPGNSGGPLLNIYGEVVGMNTAIVASGQGIGFAIPINLARLIADQLIEKGEVTRGWFGVSIQPLTRELADSFGLDRATGALVNQVLPGSPAEAAGLRRGDILLRINGKPIRGVRELQLLIASARVGESVEVIVLRDGRELGLSVKVAARNEEAIASVHGDAASESEGVGLRVGPVEQGDGVSVVAVDPESAAAQAGVLAGDVLLSINRVDVNNVAAFVRESEKIKRGDNIVLLLKRDETTMYLAFKVL